MITWTTLYCLSTLCVPITTEVAMNMQDGYDGT